MEMLWFLVSVVLLSPAIACLAIFYAWPWPIRIWLGLCAMAVGKWLSLPGSNELAWVLFWRRRQDAWKRVRTVEWSVMAVAVLVLLAAWRLEVFLPIMAIVILSSVAALIAGLRRAQAHG